MAELSKKKRKKSQSGFRRGFLSTAAPKSSQSRRSVDEQTASKPPPRPSTALREFEQEEPSQQPFLVVSSGEEEVEDGSEQPFDGETAQSSVLPLHLRLHDDREDDDFRFEAISTTPIQRKEYSQRPHQDEELNERGMHQASNILSKPDEGDAIPATRSQQNNKAPKLLIAEVDEFTQSSKSSIDQSALFPTQDILVEKDSIPRQEGNVLTVALQDNSQHSSSPEDSTDVTTLELGRALWHLRRQRGSNSRGFTEGLTLSNVATDFVTDHLHQRSHWIYVYDAILETIARECQSSSANSLTVPEVQLGIAMLQHTQEGLINIVPFLATTEEKRSRVLALGAAILLQFWIRTNMENAKGDVNLSILVTLLENVLPKLANTILQSATKRTVLSQRCLMLSYEIVAMASEKACLKDPDDHPGLYQALWKATSTVDKLLEVQQRWLSGTASISNETGKLTKSALRVNVAPSSSDATRKQCTVAVLVDWRRMAKQNQLEYQEQCCEMNGDAEAVLRCMAQYWCQQVQGINVEDGGVDHLAMGSLRQTLCSDQPELTPAHVLKSLRVAISLMHSIREDDNKENNETLQDQQRALLRGVLSWLGQSRKHLPLLAKTAVSIDSSPDSNTSLLDAGRSDSARPDATMLDLTTEYSIALLRSNSPECSELVLAILNYIWSSSAGLPPDIFEMDPGTKDAPEMSNSLPASFELMLDELKSMTSTGQGTEKVQLEPSARALCFLITRCILLKGRSLLQALVARNGLSDSTVEVLAMVLTSDESQAGPSGDSLNESSKTEATVDPLSHMAGDILMGAISSNAYVRQKMRDIPELFSGLPVDRTIPKLIGTLCSEICGNSAVTDAVSSSVSTSLTHITETNLSHNVDNMIRVLIAALLTAEEKHDSKTRSSDRQGSVNSGDGTEIRVGRICAKFAGVWRRSLLAGSVCGDDGFATVLVAIGKTMFRMPFSTVPLALLGAVLGDGPSPQDPSVVEDRRICIATATLLKLSLDELNQATCTEVALSSHGIETKKEDTGLFRRLSPLLLLRRIPSVYFRIAETRLKTDVDKNASMCSLLHQLANEMSWRLDISTAENPTKPMLTAEERRLSAEIAGRCLPFFLPPERNQASSSPCCFDNICVPAFSRALCELLPPEKPLHPTVTISDESRTKSIRIAKAALYAACHYIPLAYDDDGEGILATASFALKILTLQTVSADSDNDDEDLIQLQTGCIDFFAICLESTSQHNAQRIDRSGIEEITSPSGGIATENNANSEMVFRTSSKTMSNALTDICSTLVTILRTGKSTKPWIWCGDKYFSCSSQTGHDTRSSVEFSPSARTCLWNAFLVASQRWPGQGGQLDLWARSTLPWILDWGSSGKADLDLRHPLCMAAALQVTFVLVTRTKSFECLTGASADKERRYASIRKMHRWALESVKRDSQDGGAYASRAMRMAGLKLLLAIVSIDQVANDTDKGWQGCLSPGELGEVFAVLQGAANMDADSDVRKLAAHIVGAMRMTH